MAPVLTQFLQGEVVRFVVGLKSERKEFLIHRGLAAKHSETLKNLMIFQTRVAGEKSVKINDVDPDIFALFAQYLYTGDCKEAKRILLKENSENTAADGAFKTTWTTGAETKETPFERTNLGFHLRLYTFAKTYGVEELQLHVRNVISDTLQDLHDCTTGPEEKVAEAINLLRSVYANTPDLGDGEDELRREVVHDVCARIEHYANNALFQDLLRESSSIAIDVVKELTAMKEFEDECRMDAGW